MLNTNFFKLELIKKMFLSHEKIILILILLYIKQ